MVEEKCKKFKDKLISFFKNPKEVISFFMPILITIILLWPMPYYVEMGGGTINLPKKISIKSDNKSGYYGALYVRETKAVLFTYFLGKIIDNFDINKIEDVVLEDEEDKDYNYRELVYFNSSIDNATKIAFEKAGKNVVVDSSKFTVIYISKNSNTNLLVGDEVLEINNQKINSYNQMLKLLKTDKDSVNIKVKRNNKEIDTINYFVDIENEKKLGIVVSNEVKYTTDPKVEFNFSGSEAGPSGGLMIALTIYDKLIEQDLTNGKKVVGTGSIDEEGNVLEIGGIKHKLYAANKKKADICFIPFENKKEAEEIYNKNNYKFDLVPVKTFDEAVEYLKK